MHDEDLVEGIARAKFLMRAFSKANLKNAGKLLGNGLDQNWPSSDYAAWSNLEKKYKDEWREESIKWLNELKSSRYVQFEILCSNWMNIDEPTK